MPYRKEHLSKIIDAQRQFQAIGEKNAAQKSQQQSLELPQEQSQAQSLEQQTPENRLKELQRVIRQKEQELLSSLEQTQANLQDFFKNFSK